MNLFENEQDPLKRVLNWKNGEQPYPGYFNNFSAQVIGKIRAQEVPRPSSRWIRFMEIFDARPVMATAYALVVFGMMLFAFSFSELEETSIAGELPLLQSGLVGGVPAHSFGESSFEVAMESQVTGGGPMSGELYAPAVTEGGILAYPVQQEGYFFGETAPVTYSSLFNR